MFSELIAQATPVVAVPPSDLGTLVNSWTTSIVGIMIALGTLGGLILKFVQSHDHSPRIAHLEADMQNLQSFAGEVKQAQPQIAQAAGVVGQVVPGLQDAANAHEKQIAIMQKQVDDLTAKLNLLTTIVPATTPTAAAAAATSTTQHS